MRGKTILLAVIGATAVAVALAVGWKLWRGRVVDLQDRAGLARAREAVAQGRPSEALHLVGLHGRTAKPGGPRETEWLDVEIAASAAMRRTVRLAALHELKPDAILRNEAASAMVMRVLLQRKDEPGAAAIREAWKGRETRPAVWMAVDADALIQARRPDDAAALLGSRRFEGADDCGRLLRLALLSAAEPAKAYGLLDEAFRADPGNPDVRSFRAQVFDRHGQALAARAEYMAACAAQPDNPFHHHALADFNRRAGNHRLAVQTWEGAAQRTGLLDFMWVQAWFWDRVALGGAVEWAAKRPASGRLRPLVDYLTSLPPDRLWDDRSWQLVPAGATVLHDRQETLWLRVLQALRENREADAAALLRTSRFRGATWAPDFEAALAWLPRLRGTADGGDPPPPFRPRRADAHPLHRALQAATAGGTPAPLPELGPLIGGRAIHASLCLAEGWSGAALLLHDEAVDPASLPDWYAYGMAQAMRITRGAGAALEYAARIPAPGAGLRTLVGELHLERGERDAARAALRPVASDPSPAGVRAAFLLTLDALAGGGGPDAAEKHIAGNPGFAASLEGRELGARVHLARGDTNAAERIFRDLVATSAVAQAHFAQAAFARGDLDEAERMTQRLAEAHPDEPRHAANLRAIGAARAKAATKTP